MFIATKFEDIAEARSNAIEFELFSSKLLFISNAGTGSSPVLKAMSFDAKGRLKVNGAPGDVADANLDVVGDAKFSSTVKFANLTITQRDALSSVSAGMVIYNSTTGKFQGRTGAAWVDFH